MSEKNYEQYAYFVSRAKNFAISIKPDRKKIIDGEVVFEPGLRLEFNNGMLRIEKNKENEPIIEKLRNKIKEESVLDPKRRLFYEEIEPETMLPESKVKEVLENKNQEIARLKKELENKKK
ncbi:MAG TPA: hypothetical protein PKN54_04445 [Candidatus Cloacimonas acidaminovorans]|nr:hypothetical protein [Candidatus Cloacimonas acidaminovorans]